MGVPGPQTWGRFEDMASDEPYPGVVRRTFDAAGATVTSYAFAAGASFPIHHHPEEQIVVVEDGEVELTVGGSAQRLRAGDWAVVAPDVEHGVTARAGGARFLAIIVPRRQRADAFSIVGEDGGR